ncbi:DUF6599 family protein [Thermodesulfobacteriota bacterium]
MIQRGILKKPRFFLLLVVFLAFGPVSGFHAVPGVHAGTSAVGTSGNIEALVQGLARIAPAGWNLSKPVKTFNPKNLWEHINGRAEFFLAYGMVQMIYAKYTDSSRAGGYIDVSIYSMGTPTSAFGVFAGERQEDISVVNFGRRGYRFGAHLFIWKGPYYVRMIASEDSPRFRKMNLQMAKGLTPLLHDSGEPVWGLQALPKDDRVPGSEQFFKQDALGLEFMTDTYMARYRKKDILVTVFLSRKEHPAAAEDILRRYAVYAKQFGEGVREVKRHGVAILLCDMDGSFDALIQKGGLVGGVTSTEDPEDAAAFAYDLWQRLPAPVRGKHK